MTSDTPRLGQRISDVIGPPDGDAVSLAERYFDSFSGRWFDTLSDREHPDEITASDIVAVSMLSVNVDPHAAAWMLGPGATEISDLLTQIPSDIQLGDADDSLIDEPSAAARLWRRLQTGCWPDDRGSNGVGAVTAGKLLAAKRPALIPIYDDFVAVQLQPPAGQFWFAMRNELRDDGEARLVNAVTVGAIDARHPDHLHLSLLRKIDIVVWMREWISRNEGSAS
jgi:hypothetical protein